MEWITQHINVERVLYNIANFFCIHYCLCKDSHPTTLSCTKRKKLWKKNFNTGIFYVFLRRYVLGWIRSVLVTFACILVIVIPHVHVHVLFDFNLVALFSLNSQFFSVSGFVVRWCIVADSSSEMYPAARNCSVGTLEVHSRLSPGLARCVMGMNCRIIPTSPFLFSSLVALIR